MVDLTYISTHCSKIINLLVLVVTGGIFQVSLLLKKIEAILFCHSDEVGIYLIA
jgi:hypothetical protein